ncbi:restriction endonuclease subunit S [Mycoplasma sp. 1199]|uniref:restriction endonuclease subunit S n=1 Tax=Mycoplasma sp. 1199 TaxID=3108526 RepID=UPI002B1D8394|nr:restriction endonuclease subunit S [Mycoplasma sp. 1199]MEA4206062.1 restriction endonuclease subunit S [Mycoplasma sp. 1199]
MKLFRELLQKETINNDSIKHKTLEEIVVFENNKRIPISSENRIKGNFPYYGANGIQDYVNDYIFDGTYILIGEDGSVVKKDGTPYLQFVSGKFWVNNHAHIIKEKDVNELNLRYLYFYLSNFNIQSFVTPGNRAKLTLNSAKRIKVIVPSLQVQNKIVEILDKFSEYSAELKAELKARSTQYEYYRNSLLSNQEKEIGSVTKKLWEVTVWNRIFNDFDKDKQTKNISKYQYISASEAKDLIVDNGNIKLLTTSPSNIFTSTEKWNGEIHDDEIVYIPRGGNPYIQYWNGKFINVGNIIASSYDKNVLSNKYLFYFLKSKENLISKAYRGAGILMPYMPEILEIDITIPSIDIQNKITDVLDNFESICKNLKIGLPAEEIKRQQQYEFYRNSIFEYLETNSFEKLMREREREDNLTTGLIKLIQYIFDQTISLKLSKLIQFTNGFNFLTNANFDDSKPAASIIKIANIDKNNNLNINNAEKFNFSSYPNNDLSKYKVNKNCILIAMSGNTIGKTYFSSEELNCYINQRVGKIETQLDIINLKFIYFYLNKIIPNWIKQFYLKSSQPNINTSDIFDIEVKVPSLEIQNKIVNTLENFESICKDLKIGLPAEEIKRQQQYEFYRNSIFEYLETNSFEKLMREREREKIT